MALIGVFTMIIALIVVGIAALSILVLIGITVWKCIMLWKKGDKSQIKYCIIPILCMLLACVAYFLNFGWIRFIFFLVPIFHTIAFLIINTLSSKYIEKSVKLKRYTVLSYVTYPLFYILFPDGGDTGLIYTFFGLIHNKVIVYICMTIAIAAFAVNLTVLILQLIEGFVINKKEKENKIGTD